MIFENRTKMNKKISLCLICLSIFFGNNLLYAQNGAQTTDTLFFDCFDSGNLDSWSNTADWTVDNQSGSRLKHNLADTATVSYISAKYTDCSFDMGTTTWKFNLQTGNFTPSTSNKFGYFLMSDNDTLKSSSLSGYAVGVCMSGSSKEFVMIRYDAGKKSIIFATPLVWSEPNTSVDFEIRRQPKGIWSIGYKVDTVGADFVFTDEFTDNKYNKLPYHGFYFSCSKTRAGMFYADNVCVSLKRAPVSLLSATCTDANTIVAEFSDKIDSATASDKKNYAIPGIEIESVEYNSDEPQMVTLSTKRIAEGSYVLTVSGVRSADGAEITSQQATFSFIPPAEPFELVINELMFDPTPTVGLPNYDYIELYNNSNRNFNLGGWKLDISGSVRQFPDSVIGKGEYLILTSSSAVDSFAVFGKAISVITTTNLTNTGKTLLLISPENVVIDSLSYTETSVKDIVKNEGGWALERIDPNNTCGGWQNWAYSTDKQGGTPGTKNSVFANNIDNSPVRIVSFQPLTENKILVELSEMPSESTLQDLSNYMLKGIGNPIEYATDGCNLILTFRKTINSGENSISVKNLTDPCGNVMNDTTIAFTFHRATTYELTINEIMTTPEPSFGLPTWQWFEIYNRSESDIYLNGFSVGIGSKKYSVESGLIKSHGYAVLAKSAIADSLVQFANVVGVNKMPTLPQSGTITIFNASGEPICSTSYKSSWFDDDLKASGGYSLEKIDFNNTDEGPDNWSQTENQNGGTPGAQNSTYRQMPDTIAPNLLYVVPMDDDKLLLSFSETVRLADASLINVEPNIGNPIGVEISGQSLSTVVATLGQSLVEGTSYTLTVDSTLTDFAENHIGKRQSTFGLPEKPQSDDIVINEILFNPYPNGADFVELYNRSERAINIGGFLIANRDGENIKNPKAIGGLGYVLMPNCYVAVTANAENIADTYQCGDLYQVASLPTMADDEGSVVLLDTLGNIFDEVYYTSKMHFALLKDLNGVSLERIDFDQPSNNSGNWHSASEYAGWATPGLQNSAYKPIVTESSQQISLNSEVFSPDNDGFEDQLEIAYNFDEAGYVANVTIFNAKGLKMRTLVNNEMLGTSGFWAWDGLDDNNNRVPTGIYVIYCEVFNLDGDVTKVKKVCVVSTKM